MDYPTTTVPEESSANIVGTVREYKGGPAIGSASIDTATLQYNNLADDAEIRAEADIISDIAADGSFDTLITGAENAMIDDTLNFEYHVATIRITGTSADAKTVNLVQSVAVKVTNNRYES